MKIIKTGLYTLLGLITVLGAYIVIGSIDMGYVDDYGLLDSRIAVNDSDNGFLAIKYTEVEDYQIFDSEQREFFKAKLASQHWDADYAEAMLTKFSKEISDFLRAAEYKHFKFHPLDTADELPQYMPVMDMQRLVVLQSRDAAESGDSQRAIELADKALYMAQQIKLEANGYLISYMIGLVMQYEALHWIHRLAYDFDLDDVQIRRLLAMATKIPSAEKEGFEAVFAGEFAYAKVMAAQMLDQPLKDRWETYKNEEDYWNADLDGDWELGRENLKQELYALFSTLFPGFYLHKNRYLSAVALDYKELSKKAGLNCNEVAVPESEYQEHKLSWLELVQANSGVARRNAHPAQFSNYFYRRCSAYAQVESVKTLIALKLFEKEQGAFPASLNDLVPQYLSEHPVDPFDGQGLRYSVDDRWVYSVGKNFEDNGGDITGCYFHRCHWDDACAINPTFPADPKVCLDYEKVRSEEY